MFILRRVDLREDVGVVRPVFNAFNERHAGKRIQVEWGIGGLKMKWRNLQSSFLMRRPNFQIIMWRCCILTNFQHRQRMNLQKTDLGNVEGGDWNAELGKLERT